MPTYRQDPAAYFRAYRARKKAEREGERAAERSIGVDKALPRDALMSASEAEMAPVRAKVAALGPQRGAVITKTNGRLDAVSYAEFEVRKAPPAPQTRAVSMLAVGGKAGKGRSIAGYDPAFAPFDPQAVAINVNFVAMLRALATRVDEQGREIAGLKAREAERGRKALVMNGNGYGIARAVGGFLMTLFEGASEVSRRGAYFHEPNEE